jgi:S-adenosylmethionine synthetase
MTMLYAAEYVLPGHPDKLCDAIADALVEEAARREKRALCGVEVAVHRASVFITGRIACRGAKGIPVKEVARECYRAAGYGADWRPAPEDLDVRTNVCLGPLLKGEAAFREVSDDQSIVTGYAVDSPGTNWLPPEHWLAWRLARSVERLRAKSLDLGLGPDGKVVLVYDSETKALASFSASLQQNIGASEIELHREVRDAVGRELAECAAAIPGLKPAVPECFHVNGAGNFEVGGPEGDNGLSGKKLVVDAYGPRVPIGGGALSGKDFFKADRAGAALARRLAKAVVATGAAAECTATVAIFPGDAAFRIVSLRDGSGAALNARRWAPLIDLSLASAGEQYALTPNLTHIARHGHFTSAEHPWERIAF